MHSYEYRTKRNKPWQQCDREEALSLVAHYGNEAESILARVDAGEMFGGSTFQLRKFDPGTTPVVPQHELVVEPDGDILWVKPH